MKIICLQPADWLPLSEAAFELVFKGVHDRSLDRISFALLAVDEHTDAPICYLTTREMNAEDLCWEYGGAFPQKAATVEVYRAFCAFHDWCEKRYKRLFQVVENTNHRCLKLSMKLGFNIVGVRCIRGETLVEMVKEFSHAL